MLLVIDPFAIRVHRGARVAWLLPSASEPEDSHRHAAGEGKHSGSQSRWSAAICGLVACDVSQPSTTGHTPATDISTAHASAVHSSTARSADALAAALATEISTQTADSHVRAIIVDVNGRRRFEKYYSSSADRSRNVFSVTKSIMSTLVGIAIDEGRLGLDDRLSKLLPDHASTMKPAVARVTLRQILTMTAGFKDTLGDFTLTGLAASPNWTRYVLTHHDTPAGKEFHFSDYGANLLAPILAHATGRSPLAYARAKLFDPLGITTRPAMTAPWDDAHQHQHQYDHAQFAWPVDPQGVNVGFSSIKLRPRDLAASGSCSSTTAAGTAGKSSPPRGSPKPPRHDSARASRSSTDSSTRSTTDTSGSPKPWTTPPHTSPPATPDNSSKSCPADTWSSSCPATSPPTQSTSSNSSGSQTSSCLPCGEHGPRSRTIPGPGRPPRPTRGSARIHNHHIGQQPRCTAQPARGHRLHPLDSTSHQPWRRATSRRARTNNIY